jgi:quinoprotein glucose dehydrogenase
MASEPDTGAVYVVSHDNPGILKLLDPDAPAARRGGPPVPAGQLLYQEHCQACHGANRQGTDTGVALVHASTDAASGAVAGASRFDADAIKKILATGKGRMPPFPHLAAADTETLVGYLTAPPAGGRGFGGGRGGGGQAGSSAPAELIAGSGSVAPRAAGGGRGRGGAAYPEGSPSVWKQYTINEYNTVGNKIKPPFTTIVKYDLNEPRIQWQIGFGDDPDLAARGITGTGAPAVLNGLVVTASGLVFGAGRDNQIRAWDSATGKQLWSSRFGGDFVGAPVMYEMGGRQYLLVPAASAAPRRGGGAAAATGGTIAAAPAAPLGWVAYALPAQAN